MVGWESSKFIIVQIISKQFGMERKYSYNESALEEVSLTRRSTIGYQTEQLNQMDYVIGEIVLQNNFKMAAFIDACNQHPQIKDETKLIHQQSIKPYRVFLKPQFVRDLVSFLVAPQQLMGKLKLSVQEGRMYVSTVADFMRENYEFYEFYFLSLEKGILKVDMWFQFLEDPQASTFYTSLGYLADIFIPFVKYEFSTSSRIEEYFQKSSHNLEGGSSDRFSMRHQEQTILLINYFSEELLGRLLGATQYQAVFKVLLSLVVASLQEQEWWRSLELLKGLCRSGVQQGITLDSHIENLYLMVKEVGNNIDKDIHNTIFAFTDAFVQTNLVGASLNRILILLASKQSPKGNNSFSFQEELVLEYNLKLVGEIINIYCQLLSNGIGHLAGQMVKLKQNILQVYQSLGPILKLLRVAPYRGLNFSSGENIRSISLPRLEFLNLLRISLLLIKEHGDICPQLRPNIDKSEILQFLSRCLSENRWNSIAHCLIEKVVCLMINTQFFKTRSTAIRRFLSFLVQAFSNKKYIFLNSAKMTTQGDLHSLYIISRKITAELDRMPAIVDASSDYDFWKTFVLNVLQKYENNRERLSSNIECQEEERKDKGIKDGDLRVEIDEVALIKEIVRKIEVNKKWSFKRDNRLSVARINSASDLKKRRASQNSQKSDKQPATPTTPCPASKYRTSTRMLAKPSIEAITQLQADPIISPSCIKELSSMEQLEASGSNHSNHSSEEVHTMMQMSSRSDTDQLEETKSESEKMTQSGW